MEMITSRTNALCTHLRKLGSSASYRRQSGEFLCDSPKLLERKDEFLAQMKLQAEKKDFSMMILMLTDVLLEGTQIIYLGDEEVIRQAFNVSPKDNTAFLPHVMSRKKQIIPMLTAIWG